jgi:serine/threonine protein kinase/predicted Zn-dependent protease
MSGNDPPQDRSGHTLPHGSSDPDPSAVVVCGAGAPPSVPGFEILGELGRGGMGVVYKAWQSGLNRVVALKMIGNRSLSDLDTVARFRREATAVARLQHPNIVHVHEIGEHDGNPYLVMEHVSGTSLKVRLTGSPLSSRATAGLLETLARAVSHAHRQGVIHRDLKPANILLSPNLPALADKTLITGTDAAEPTLAWAGEDLAQSTPKIVDFGLAKLPDSMDDPTLSGALLGTPNYMAPEQARGDAKRVGPAADVWALGAILYECLTGRPPFQGETTLDTLWLIGEQEPVPPSALNPRIPRDLETICLKSLEKSPDRRYAAVDLADDLGRFLRDEPIRARPPSAAYQMRQFARRNKGLLAAVTAVFLALVVGLIGAGIGMVRARAGENRARLAERETRDLLAASYAQAAQLALRRGAWRDALAQFDRALDAGHPDQASLHLQKARAFCAVHDIPNAVAEVDALAKRSDLGDLAGQVKLMQADLALGRGVEDQSTLGLVRQALDQGLQPAETEYALGLLATSSPEAVRHFEQAVAADPFHQRANGMLGLTLIVLGKLPAARGRLTTARLLFPDDPTFAVLLAMTAAAEGDMTAAGTELNRVRDQLGEGPTRSAQKLIEAIRQLRELAAVFNDDPSRWPLAMATKLAPMFAGGGVEIQSLRQQADGPSQGLLLPVPPVLIGAVRGAVAALPFALFGRQDRAIASLEQAYRVHPDALLAFMRGVVAFDDKTMAVAEQAFLEAVDGSSIVPIQRIALFAAIACENDLAEREPTMRREMTDRAIQNARKLLAFGPLPPWQAGLIAKVAIDVGDLDLARRAIADWERQTPKDALLWRKRLEVELIAKAYGPAITAADKLLELKPNDADAVRLRKAAVDRLVREAHEHQ